MQTRYLGISNDGLTLCTWRKSLRIFFPRPIKITLSDENMLEFEKEFERICYTWRKSFSWNISGLKIRNVFRKKLILNVQKTRFGSLKINKIIGKHRLERNKWYLPIESVRNAYEYGKATVIKSSEETVIVFYRDDYNGKDTIYVI